MGDRLPQSVIQNVQTEFMRLFPERRWDVLGWPKFNADVPSVGLFSNDREAIELDLYSSSVYAGFPSPADIY